MLGRTVSTLGGSSQRLGKNVTFYLNESASAASGSPTQTSDEHRPLMLLLPWLGSRPQAVAKYCDIYFRAGWDVLVVESEAPAIAAILFKIRCMRKWMNQSEFVKRAFWITGASIDRRMGSLFKVRHFLWPRSGRDHGLNVLELLHSKRFVSRPLLVHAFSIGGFLYSQLLVNVSLDLQKYQTLTERIKGQIFDSLVPGSVELMVEGLGKALFPRWENLLKNAALSYFYMFPRHTVDYINLSIDVFRNSPVRAPVLFFYCENDALSNPRAMEELIDHFQKCRIDVTTKKWEDSTHVGHLKLHQHEYLSTLNTFLLSLQIVPPKAKL